MAPGYRQANSGRQRAQHAVETRTEAPRMVQAGGQKHRTHRHDSHPLKDAQVAWFQVHDMLLVQRIADEHRAERGRQQVQRTTPRQGHAAEPPEVRACSSRSASSMERWRISLPCAM